MKTWADANEGMDCMDQCLHFQSLNKDPHYANVFCYSAAELGWDVSSPKWETRMEVRCQEGYWADKMHHRRRRHDSEMSHSHRV